MSKETPDRLGELSMRRLNEAIERIEDYIKDRNPSLMREVEIIKLIKDVPRRSPWYGVIIDPNDNSVTIGVVLRNIIDLLEVQAWRAKEHQDVRSIASSAEHEANRLKARVIRGRIEYDDYLDKLIG